MANKHLTVALKPGSGPSFHSPAKSGQAATTHGEVQNFPKVQYKLDTLVGGITAANSSGEFSFARPVGKEVM